MRSISILAGMCPLLIASTWVAAATPSPAQEVVTIEKQTLQIRHLTALHPVEVQILDDAPFTAALQGTMHRLTPESEVQLSQRESVLLGLLGKSDNLDQIYFSGLSPQVAGLYDYQRKILYVRNHNNDVFGPNRWTIAHEFTHALQDQHFNLEKLMPDESAVQYRNSDAEGAHHALSEGDAVTTEVLFIERTYSAADMKAFTYAQAHLPKAPTLPMAFQREFDFPYTVGVAFVEGLYKQGGMAAINAAYQNLPNSTYVIMHPAAYLHGWKPVTVTLHSVAGFAGWKQEDDDVFGAFGYNLLLWQYLPKREADKVTDAYRGDRYIYLENGTQEAMLFKSVWTTSRTARAAETALIAALRVRFPHAVSSRVGADTAVSYASGAVYFQRSNSSLVMAYGPTVALARQLSTAPTT